MIERMVAERTCELEARSRQLEAEIVRRQTLEAQLLQAQKLESIGQLAAGIAHEINTPMQFLSDNIEFLSNCSKRLFEVVDLYEQNLFSDVQQRPWGERKQELRAMMERNRFDTIREQVPQAISESVDGIQRVIHIVRAMKEFSHPGNEQKSGVDLNNAVHSMVTITRNRWKYVAELELDLDPNLPTLNCVPADVNQVLINLIVNAADAIAEKVGEDGAQKGQIAVRTGTDGENILIEVEDTGCGIPAHIRSRIFDPFFTTKDVGKGTGQGLAICYNVVVNKHQGTIDAMSTPGEGTIFRIALPRTAKAMAAVADETTGDAAAEPALTSD
jgi:signal transduction histidine kinase